MSKMLAEIREQPWALERTLREGISGAKRLRRELEGRRPRLVVLVARGTSDNAAQFGRYLIETTTGIPVSLAASSVVTLYKAKLDFEGALVVAISQSGESTDTNFVLERARDGGAVTVGITNEANSTLASLAAHRFLVRAGREKSVAATKTYTGQLMMLYLLAWALGARIDLDDLRRIPGWAAKALESEAEVGARAERYRFMEHAVVIGRGLNYSNAFEFALKLMETCYVVAERFSAADLLHGPIAMVEHSFPAFLFAPPGPASASIGEVIGRLEQLKAETLIIADRSSEVLKSIAVPRVVLPLRLAKRGGLPADIYTPVPYVIPAQLFAAVLAVQKGFDPDRPRTLSKVTRTL